MTDFNYREYSLSKLSEWIHDALSSAEASPHEIYSVIRKAVQEEYNIHKEYSQRCLGLLELLSGHRPVNLDDDCEEHYYPEEVNKTNSKMSHAEFHKSEWEKSRQKENPNKWILSVEVDGASGEYYLQLPDDLLDSLSWKEGDTLEYVDNGNQTFKVRKITKLIGMDEC